MSRERRGKKCRRCQVEQMKKSETKPETQTVLMLSSDSEGDRLWRHVAVGTGTCVGMIEQYAALGMPGYPVAAMREIRRRLDQVIQQQEANNANSDSSE